MEFATPAYGWLIIPVVILALLSIRAFRKKEQSLQALAEPHLLPRLIRPQSPLLLQIRLLLPIIFMLFLTLALMRPQWGLTQEESSTTGLDIVIALDVSKSMLADDLPPSRLSVATKAIGKLTESLGGDRIGLVAFAGAAFQVCPLTTDHAVFSQLLAETGPATIPRGGSSIKSVAAEVKRAFKGTTPGGRILILVSDGEYHDSVSESDLDDLRREGIHLFAACTGTVEGGLIPLSGGNFVKDRHGTVVKSRASIAALKAIDPTPVVITPDGDGLVELLAKARTTATETTRKGKRLRLEEQFQVPLALALLFCSADFFLHGRRGRR